MKKIIVVIGAPCSGKRTHAKLLSESLKYKYFSTDDFIFEEIQKQTKFGLMAKKYTDVAKPVPDEYLIPQIKNQIITLKEDGIVFHLYPRTLTQAKELDYFLFNKKINKLIPILLSAEPIMILNRISEKTKTQGNEASEAFVLTMNQHLLKMQPVIDYYLHRSIEFDTSKESEREVNEKILKAIKKCL